MIGSRLAPIGPIVGHLGQAPAQLVAAMPGQQPGLDGRNPRRELRQLLSQRREHVLGQRAKGLVRDDARQQRFDLVEPFGGNQAELCRVAANRVGELRPAPDQHIPRADQHLRRRLIGTFHRYKPPLHARPAHRLADRLGVCRIVLATRHIGFHVLGRHQDDPMAQFPQLPCPVMGAPAGFQADPRRLQLAEERQDLPPPQLAPQYNLLVLVDPVQLKNAFRNVDADACYLGHGRLPLMRSRQPHPGTSMPSGAVHTNRATAVRLLLDPRLRGGDGDGSVFAGQALADS